MKILFLHLKIDLLNCENLFKKLNKENGFFEKFYLFVDQIKKTKHKEIVQFIGYNIKNKKRICQIIETMVSTQKILN